MVSAPYFFQRNFLGVVSIAIKFNDNDASSDIEKKIYDNYISQSKTN
jgi:hypothetical protein